MNCIECKKKEIVYEARRLCKVCYRKKRHKGLPKISQSRKNELFKTRLEKRFPGILQDYEKLFKNHFISLTDLGKKHGFTRERARQIFKTLYGSDFGLLMKLRHEIRDETENTVCIHDPRRKIADYKKGTNQYRGAVAEKKFFVRCIERGFEVAPNCDGLVDLRVNDKNVDVKSCWQPHQFHPNYPDNLYLRYASRKKQFNHTDFFACYYPSCDSFFIIPKKSIPFRQKKYTGWHIRTEKREDKQLGIKNSYWEYFEAWHLLMKEGL